jgi:hypothetical protein
VGLSDEIGSVLSILCELAAKYDVLGVAAKNLCQGSYIELLRRFN